MIPARTLPIAMLLALVGLAAADIPWPPYGKLPFPGAPALINGAWLAQAGSPENPQFSLFREGLNAGGRINPDGGLRSSVAKVLSYECLDSNTFRYISQDNSSVDGGEVTTKLTCAVARINATHRVVSNYAESDGKCPDASSLPDAEKGFTLSNTTGLIKYQVFTRVDGVLPGELTLVCKNSTKQVSLPVANSTGDSLLGTRSPADLGTPLGATTPTGVWKAEGSMQIITPKGFMVVFQDSDGSMRAVNGLYQSHKCIDADSYVAANAQMQMFGNGTTAKGFHCEKGVRDGDNLALSFSNGPDCAALATASGPADSSYTLLQSIPGIPTECAIAQQVFPGQNAPASSAVRSALGSAVAAAFVALLAGPLSVFH